MPRGKHLNRCIDCNRLYPEKDLYYDHRCIKCHRHFKAENLRLSKLKDWSKRYNDRQRKRKTY